MELFDTTKPKCYCFLHGFKFLTFWPNSLLAISPKTYVLFCTGFFNYCPIIVYCFCIRAIPRRRLCLHRLGNDPTTPPPPPLPLPFRTFRPFCLTCVRGGGLPIGTSPPRNKDGYDCNYHYDYDRDATTKYIYSPVISPICTPPTL